MLQFGLDDNIIGHTTDRLFYTRRRLTAPAYGDEVTKERKGILASRPRLETTVVIAPMAFGNVITGMPLAPDYVGWPCRPLVCL